MAQTKVKLISDGVIVQSNLHASHGITTADIGENASYLYYTDARVSSYLSTNGYATQTDIVAAITDSAPVTLDTLNELAAALGDDPNFATTTANSIGLKAPLASPSFTGNATFAGKISSVRELINVNSANGTRSGGFEVQDDGDLFIGTATTAGNIVLETGNSTNGLPSTGTARLTINSTGATFAGEVSLKSRLNLQRSSGGATTLIQFKNENGVDRAHIDFGGTNEELSFFSGAGGSEHMRISGTGNVGIGTVSPDNILHIRNGDTTYASQVGADTMLFLETTNVSNALQFTSANTGQQYIMFGDDDPNAGWISYNHSDNNLNFRVNGSEKIRITSAGNIQFAQDGYINTNTADASDNLSLQLSGGGAFGDTRGACIALAGNENGNGGLIQLRAGQGQYSEVRTYTSGAERTRVEDNGDFILYGGRLYLNSGTGYNNTGYIYLSNGRTAIESNIVNATANGDTSLNFKTRKGGTTASAMFINEFRNVMIGTTTQAPSAQLTIALNDSVGGRLSLSNLRTALFDGDEFGRLSFVSNDETQTGDRARITALCRNTGAATDLVFYTGNTSASVAERMRILSNGNISIPNGSIEMNPSGGQGIYLGSNNGSNRLDDYEEGSWTPQVYYQNSTDQANATNTVAQGKYTKIGNLVFIQFRLDFSQSSSSPVNDNIGVKNLPFAGANNHYAGGGNVITSVSSSNGYNLALPNAGSTIAILNNSGNVGNYGGQFGSGSNKYIRGSLTYIAQ